MASEDTFVLKTKYYINGKKSLPDKTHEKDLGKNDLEKQMQASFNCPTQSEIQTHRDSPSVI